MGVLLGLLACFAWTALANDTMRIGSGEGATEVGEELIWKFSMDMGDLTDRSETSIEDEISQFFENYVVVASAELDCKVSVTGKVNIGVASVDITVEVSGPCSKVRTQGKAIAKQVLSELQRALR